MHKIFHEIGRLPNKYKIKLKEGAESVMRAARQVPVALKERQAVRDCSSFLKAIIRKVEELTEWVNSLIILKKTRIHAEP